VLPRRPPDPRESECAAVPQWEYGRLDPDTRPEPDVDCASCGHPNPAAARFAGPAHRLRAVAELQRLEFPGQRQLTS